MSKDSSAKYYQNNKERPQKKLVKDIVHKRKKVKEGLSKEYKEKTDNMVVNDSKIYHKIKNKSLFSIEENIIR